MEDYSFIEQHALVIAIVVLVLMGTSMVWPYVALLQRVAAALR